jgi:VanZ family protein
MFFPVAAGIIATMYDINAVFAVLCLVLGLTIAILVSYRKTYLSYCT